MCFQACEVTSDGTHYQRKGARTHRHHAWICLHQPILMYMLASFSFDDLCSFLNTLESHTDHVGGYIHIYILFRQCHALILAQLHTSEVSHSNPHAYNCENEYSHQASQAPTHCTRWVPNSSKNHNLTSVLGKRVQPPSEPECPRIAHGGYPTTAKTRMQQQCHYIYIYISINLSLHIYICGWLYYCLTVDFVISCSFCMLLLDLSTSYSSPAIFEECTLGS